MLSIDAWLDEKPYKELYDGAVHEKVSPQFDHAELSLRIGTLLAQWAGDRGKAGVELRVYLAEGTTLVPDVAYVSRECLGPLGEKERQTPPFAPDIAVEIRSPEDRDADIRRKTQLYLAHGATIVLNVDPCERTVRMNDDKRELTLSAGDVVEHPAFADLHVPLAEIFAPLDRKL